MKLEPSIRTELRFVAGGLLIGDALICAVFALEYCVIFSR